LPQFSLFTDGFSFGDCATLEHRHSTAIQLHHTQKRMPDLDLFSAELASSDSNFTSATQVKDQSVEFLGRLGIGGTGKENRRDIRLKHFDGLLLEVTLESENFTILSIAD
jgi:hypothetical protein